MMMLVVLKKTDCSSDRTEIQNCLLGAGVLGDGLGALRHGVLGQLTREEEPGLVQWLRLDNFQEKYLFNLISVVR